MAELTTPAETATSSCCAPETQASCCEPSAKAACCDPNHGDGCGCSAGTVRGRALERPQRLGG
jgi:arsenite methyltransferase